MVWRIRLKDRVLEWHVACYTAIFGLWLSAPADSLNPQTLRLILDLVPEGTWALVFALTGTAHLMALAINGAAWWTPHVRAAAASFNFLAYATLAYSIWLASAWSTGVPTYCFVSTLLATVIFRAFRDVFLSRRAENGR